MTTAPPVRLTLITATWCPHCVPLSTDRLPALAKRLGLPSRVLDIDDPTQETEADRLVRSFGRWDDDYVIPQLFLERTDGTADPILVGVRGSPTSLTRQRWEELLADPDRFTKGTRR
ncbi:MAG: hypothetical protein L3K00_04215 [Thermoplasmata archaeon]|nr:hypothetical protein [Thermoplasmata archaeon]MCI4361794.1 hypothetical protein [Thermoplasmata archaeon]